MAPLFCSLLFTIAFLLPASVTALDMTQVSATCSSLRFDPAVSSFDRQASVLYDKLIVDINVNVGRWNDASDTNHDVSTAFGVASCSPAGIITHEECVTCLTVIVLDYLKSSFCDPRALGMQVTLRSCSIQVENVFVA